MWQTKYAAAIPINLGVGVNFRPSSEGYFLSGRPQSVSSFICKRNPHHGNCISGNPVTRVLSVVLKYELFLTHCVHFSSVAVAKSKLLMHLPFIHCNLGHDIYLTKRTYFHTHSAEFFCLKGSFISALKAYFFLKT